MVTCTHVLFALLCYGPLIALLKLNTENKGILRLSGRLGNPVLPIELQHPEVTLFASRRKHTGLRWAFKTLNPEPEALNLNP